MVFDQLTDVGFLDLLELVRLLLNQLAAFLTTFLCFLVLGVVLRWFFGLRLLVFYLLGNKIEEVLIPDG